MSASSAHRNPTHRERIMTLPLTWKKTALLLALASASLAFSATTFAHGATKPSHGGIVQMSGETLVELLTEPTGVSVFVVDEDEEVPSSGMSAKLVITYKGAKSEVAMKAAAGNRFEAKGTKVKPGSKVEVMLTNTATMAKTSAEFTAP